MPQLPRELIPKQYYHFITRSNNHIRLFQDQEDFTKYLRLIKYYFRKGHIHCIHYCCMNTHAHFVVYMPGSVRHVGSIMKYIQLKYYHYFHKKYNHEGILWWGRYRSAIIDTENYMLGCGLYIEHNPVKAGIVTQPDEYQWSSYRHWIGAEKNDLVVIEHPLQDVIRDYKNIAADYIDSYIEYEHGKKGRM
ncbi:MAG: transposase [bacterium]